MSELSIKLNWQRLEETLTPQKYSTTHSLYFTEKFSLVGGAAPEYGGDPENTNPEQGIAASLSSCYLMTFLALSAKAGWPVASYNDHAVAYLGKNPKGKIAVMQIDLNPQVKFDAGFDVTDEELDKMHDRAHRYCFIANSLADYVTVNINIT